ncbi:MED14-domain-containing protein [Gonapodya prolifera JEL478]|uniref:Mediator of RNA polymerase II transcription subunit 14 n=1 Tax=Gonapodya prolifera (strain JEL478) TaxID=1344416 RepID=A0A139ARU2_GONPJ|nr:MED14-domain-containing protein [Gonapodya prolifera JEL478]|eukprot:KXS19195.1 MED14-domain-containing protein [Gonapodya prolifera JEL478]
MEAIQNIVPVHKGERAPDGPDGMVKMETIRVPRFAQDSVPLKDLLSRLIHRTNSELRTLVETLPSKTDMDRKKELYRFVVATRQQFTKLLVLVRWCKRYAGPTQSMEDIFRFLGTQSMLADWNTFVLAEKEMQGRSMR